MEDILRSKGLYIKTLGIEISPNDVENKAKWDSINDLSYGWIGISITLYFRFHLDGLDSPIGRS